MSPKKLLFALVLLEMGPQCIAEETQQQAIPVFVNGEVGYASFRIPALIRTAGGRLLAFAEGRRNSANDTGDIDLVLRHSDDEGQTWSAIRCVWDDGSNVCGNPAPVVDPKTGRILLLACWNDGRDSEREINDRTSRAGRRIFLLTSDDNGDNWSVPREITSQVKDSTWTWYATGPCHAIVLTRGSYRGRIVVPCDHGSFQSGETYYASHVIFSDDGGVSWHVGGSVPGGNECTIAELSDGRLILNMRWQGRLLAPRTDSPFRRIAISHDGGETFEPAMADTALPEPVCNASLLNLYHQGRASSRLVFCNPANTQRRSDLTIRVSRDNGQTWSSGVRLTNGFAAYSDLVRLSRGIGVLYESRTEEIGSALFFRKLSESDLFRD